MIIFLGKLLEFIKVNLIIGVLRNVQQQVKKFIKQWRPPTQTELEKLKKW